MTLYFIYFLVGCVVVVFSGLKLSYYGDIIGEKTGIEKGFIGFLLLAFITSVPELTVSISAVTLQDNPDLSTGNVYGSNIFNIFILAIMDFLYKDAPILSKAGRNNIVSAALGIMIMVVSGVALLLPWLKIDFFLTKTFFHISWMSFVIILVYILSMFVMYELEHRETPTEEDNDEEEYAGITLKKAIIMFSLLSLCVIAGGTFLTWIGDKMAKTPFNFLGKQVVLGSTFVGSLFIALATSLPELVVSFGAIRLGQIDMAMGNVLGSNIFNVSILTIADIFYTKGSLFASIRHDHLLTLLMAVLVSSVVIFSISYQKFYSFSLRKISLESVIITLVYIISMYIIFITGQAL